MTHVLVWEPQWQSYELRHTWRKYYHERIPLFQALIFLGKP
jgi:hypothetical protein